MPIQLVNYTDDLLCCHILGHAMDCEGILSDYNDVSPMAVNEERKKEKDLCMLLTQCQDIF